MAGTSSSHALSEVKKKKKENPCVLPLLERDFSFFEIQFPDCWWPQPSDGFRKAKMDFVHPSAFSCC